MPKRSKRPQQQPPRQYDPKFYAHAYAARLAKQVAAELQPSHAASSASKIAAKRR